MSNTLIIHSCSIGVVNLCSPLTSVESWSWRVWAIGWYAIPPLEGTTVVKCDDVVRGNIHHISRVPHKICALASRPPWECPVVSSFFLQYFWASYLLMVMAKILHIYVYRLCIPLCRGEWESTRFHSQSFHNSSVQVLRTPRQEKKKGTCLCDHRTLL